MTYDDLHKNMNPEEASLLTLKRKLFIKKITSVNTFRRHQHLNHEPNTDAIHWVENVWTTRCTGSVTLPIKSVFNRHCSDAIENDFQEAILW